MPRFFYYFAEMRIGNFLMLLFLFGCTNPKRYDSLAFDYIPDNKSELERGGFKKMVYHNPFGKDSMISNDWLYKKVNDTLIQFFYEGDKLLRKEILFSLKKFDSSLLFQKFYGMGFTRMPSAKDPRHFSFVRSSRDKPYDVDIAKNELLFTLIFDTAKNTPPPTTVIAPLQ